MQTAAGSSTAEMTIEGLHDFEAVRDFLYERMRRRGKKPSAVESAAGSTGTVAVADGADLAEVVAALREATDELRQLRAAVDASGVRVTDRPATDRHDGAAS